MRRLVIRLFVALFTFGLGVAASLAWSALRPAPAHHAPVRAVLVVAQDDVSPRPVSVFNTGAQSIISGGVLNGKAISKPAPLYPPIARGKAISEPVPLYPPIARAARAEGTVTVQIVVDENGNVMTARAVSGHPLLQTAAVAASYQARFTPTWSSGQPIKVSGVITYNFVLE